MSARQKLKFVHEGHYVAEIPVEYIEPDAGWSPTLSLKDAYRLDSARAALKAGDLDKAALYGRVYELKPVVNAR